ncbi:amino acid adenylation domain-containing protein [Allocatelliglobosispora scoriae]|uniref:Amino acid adenylation domain-containing protein n=1 Tax=Allocatelliglobosispora scoriae TaxID=643052 RepID=A0A841C6E6_9ACTN|nr:non-ribosomal peptide synthetase [Allocatelliglobosispora scoriae]MBB5874662.1 amino acid adenylation domain-containing protein [Allocatelliglobosispora scoriae]
MTIASEAGVRELPLTFAQQRLWSLDQLVPGMTAYNMYAPFRMRGPLDHDALQWAFTQVVTRHEVLRATFPSADGEPVQRVAPPGELALAHLDLSGLPLPQAEQRARELVTRWLDESYDLANGPLIKARLIHLGPRDHILVLLYHHIVCDGWSLNIIFDELAALYGARLTGAPDPLPPLPTQYGDYAAWQRGTLTDDYLAEHLDFWRAKLGDAPAHLDLPTDRRRPAVQQFDGERYHLTVAPDMWSRVQAAARSYRVTPFMLLYGCYAALLSRWSGSTDFLIGVPMAARLQTGVEPLVGNFVNILPMRVDLAGDPTIGEFVRRIRGATLEYFAHQEVPFEKLVEVLRPNRTTSYSPLVQIMFTLQNLRPVLPGFPGVDVEVFRVELNTSFLDLWLEFAPRGDEATATFRYMTSLFDGATIVRIAAAFERFLAAFTAESGLRLSELPLLGEQERAVVRDEWSRSAPAVTSELLVPDLIAEAARLHPDRTAVRSAGRSLTYRELDARANQVAHALIGRGIGPESVVGLHLDRGPEFVTAMLGVLKAGGAYLPLDPASPPDRIARMVAIAGAALVLDPPGLDRLDLAEQPVGPPVVRRDPDHLAYVIFTSGSTGDPKGVGVGHAAIANRLLWMRDAYGLQPEDRVLHKTPATFDVSVWELLLPLLTGARLVLAEPGRQGDPDHLVELIEAERVTITHFVPPMLAAFLDSPDVGRCTSLRLVVCSGQALPPELRDRFTGLLPARLENLYGPTEAAVDVTAWRCDTETGRHIVPIGRPIAGVQTYVLDAGLGLAPIDVPGELYLGGVALARGYAGRPDLTADRFVPHPFATTPGERLYRTGDQVRWRAGGVLEYLGRNDEQVKIRGYRIEPGEIQAALTGHPRVRQALVVGHQTTGDHQELVAYLVCDQPAPDAAELRRWLGQRLPAYLVPTAFAQLEAFPLTRNGKVDRAALPAPDGRVRAVTGFAAAATGVEVLITEVWAELLGLTEVGVLHNFFDLGGNSLTMSKVRARLAARLGREIPMLALYEHPTVSSLARHLDGGSQAEADLAAAFPHLRPGRRSV